MNDDYQIERIACDRIFYDSDFNCRGEFTLESVHELSESITKVGRLIEPILVQPASDVEGGLPAGFDWRLIGGHRRYKAVTVFLKWTTIPCSIQLGLDDHAARLINLTENLERKNLNPLEEARALAKLFPAGITVREAAAEVKRPTRWVHARMRLLKLPEEVQQMVAAGRLPMVDLEAIFQNGDTPEAQIEAANIIVDSKRGRWGKRIFVGKRIQRKCASSRRKTKQEISAMILQLLEAGVDISGARAAAWCAGNLRDAEIQEDIEISIRLRDKPPSTNVVGEADDGAAPENHT